MRRGVGACVRYVDFVLQMNTKSASFHLIGRTVVAREVSHASAGPAATTPVYNISDNFDRYIVDVKLTWLLSCFLSPRVLFTRV